MGLFSKAVRRHWRQWPLLPSHRAKSQARVSDRGLFRVPCREVLVDSDGLSRILVSRVPDPLNGLSPHSCVYIDPGPCSHILKHKSLVPSIR